MRWGLGAGATLGAVAAVVAVAQPAQAALQVRTSVSTQRVGVGESFYVQLTATTDGPGSNQVMDPHLSLPPGMTAERPTASPQSQVSIVNGQMSQRTGVTVTWTVTVTKPGSFRIGPPSFTFVGEHAQGNPIQIEVVTGGTSGGPGRQRGFDPFDLLDPMGRGGLPFPPGFNLKSPFDDDTDEQPQEQAPSYPEEMRVDKPPDPTAFVRSTLTPDHVYVGQQVTLRVFAYGGQGPWSIGDANEPSHADFLTFDTPAEQTKAYLVPSGGQRFIAAKLRELALFPLHAGKLRAGRMKVQFTGRGYMHDAKTGTERESNWAEVVVIEPPLDGRPAGYKIGDVGDYKLTATVEPREIMAGEAVSVVATLSGVGNVPFKIQTPEHSGVEWLEPQLNEKVEVSNGLVQGSRKFSYVVKINEAGKLDLGEVTLPYFDAKKRVYVTARAALGVLDVKPNPNAKPATAEAKPDDRLANVLQPRASLGAFPTAQRPLSDRSGFWAALLLAPFGMVFAGGAVSAAARARSKLRERGASLGAQQDAALREARKSASTDVAASVSATERAVFLAIEAKLGFKARALLKTDLASALTERGLSSERAEALAKLLEDCDTLRFVGAASGIDPAELAERANKLATEIAREKLAPASVS